MTVSYATEAALAVFLGTTAPSDAERLLLRASELVDDKVRAPFDVDEDGDGLPTDDDVATTLEQATCAQVEFWIEVGEEHDTGGEAGVGVAIGNLRVDRLPPELAPRARRLLRQGGLLNAPTEASF